MIKQALKNSIESAVLARAVDGHWQTTDSRVTYSNGWIINRQAATEADVRSLLDIPHPLQLGEGERMHKRWPVGQHPVYTVLTGGPNYNGERHATKEEIDAYERGRGCLMCALGVPDIHTATLVAVAQRS